MFLVFICNKCTMACSEESDFYVELDVGNLCVLYITNLKKPIDRGLSAAELKHVAAYGTQQLLNEIIKLPSEYHEHVPVAKLPQPTTVLPREKPVPTEKPMTKWEKFAKAKGITKEKKEKVWDETSKEWKAQYGYRGFRNQEDWVMEVPDNADPNEDMFAKAKEAKKERVAKNEFKRLRNIGVAEKVKVTNLESVDRANKHQLSRSMVAAKTATASLGRFADTLPKEKPPKDSMKKRKFKPNTPSDLKTEKENSLKIFESLDKKKPKLNVQEAVQRYLTKPIKESKASDNQSNGQDKRRAKKNRFIKKNLYRDGKKPKSFRKT